MSCNGIPRSRNLLIWLALTGALFVIPFSASAAIIVDDTWADGGRNNGADPLDSNWWSSVSSTGTGIEVSPGSLGMVTGSAGRGIHTVFPTQTLANIGDKLVATYTFTTPATIGTTSGSGAFRVGLFDTLGRAGLDADVASSSGTPNSLYGYFATNTPGLPGYMLDMDVSTGTEDISFRQLDLPQTASTPTGRLLGTTTGFTQLSPTGVDGGYVFAPNTTYTGSFTMTRISATDMQLTGTLGAYSHTNTDAFDSTNVGMLAFWANSNIFGSSANSGEANNGIDFSHVTVEFIPVPEPAMLTMAALATLGMALVRRRW
jgi:hypothetical protein